MEDSKAAPPEQPAPEPVESNDGSDDLKAMLAGIAQIMDEVKTLIESMAKER